MRQGATHGVLLGTIHHNLKIENTKEPGHKDKVTFRLL